MHAVFPLCLKRSVSAPVPLRPPPLNTRSPLIGQLIHTWASTANSNKAAVLKQFLCGKHPVNVWHGDVTKSRDYWRGDSWAVFSKGGRGSDGADFDLFNFQDL